MEEADIIGINKVDKLSDHQRAELYALIEDRFPEKVILELSGREGTGVDAWLTLLATERAASQSYMEVDYDKYAVGEAQLGWLNCQLILESSEEFDLDAILMDLAELVAARLKAVKAETAHLKILGEGGESSGLVNLVDSEQRPELSVASRARCLKAHLVVNARVATDPEILEAELRAAGDALAEKCGIQLEWRSVQCFRPGRPVPTHRAQ